MSAPVVAPEVARFVAAVRAELADLDPDVVEELTGGLEADLTDSLEAARTAGSGSAEAVGPDATAFGDPVGYAAELRSSAGLPPRAPAPRALSTLGPLALVAALQERAALLGERVRRHPRWPSVRDFALALRPVWWVARAWVAHILVLDALFQSEQEVRAVPQSPGPVLLLLVAVVVSVQLGRRSATRTIGAWRWPVLLGNVLALLLLPVALGSTGRPFAAQVTYVNGASIPSDGLYLNGNPVTNVLPYDSAGRPLSGVQLFDQNGEPLALTPNSPNNTVQDGDLLSEGLPLVDANGEARWNVFPLQQRPIDPSQPLPSPSVSVGPVPSASGGSSQAPTAPGSPSAPAPAP
jgi:hypothetical protein